MEKTAIVKISDYMRSDMVRARFAEIVGEHDSGAYIASALLTVANSEALQACTPQTVYTAALQAATLRLTTDSNTGQAYLVPYGNKCTLIVGYKGLIDLAVRTGKYRYINVGPIYEGEEIGEDRISGFLKIEGHRTSKKVIGWIGAFELYKGYAKSIYMTVEEIHQHAQKYSKAYNNAKSGWKTDTQKMEKKTVLRLLLRRWGYLDPSDAATLNEVEGKDDEQIVDGQAVEVRAAEAPPPAEEEADPAASSGTVERPLSPATLRSFLAAKAAKYKNYQVVPEQLGLMVGMLEEAFAPDKDADKIRRSCLAWLWDSVADDPTNSSKSMTGAEVKATLDWVKPVKDSGGAYHIDKIAAMELHAVYKAALKEAGQLELT